MSNDVFIAAAGTVTISTEEYRRLVERSAYLDVIIHSEGYRRSDNVEVVDGLLNAGDKAENGGDDDAE